MKVHFQLVRLVENKHEGLLRGGSTIPQIVLILLQVCAFTIPCAFFNFTKFLLSQVVNTELSNHELNGAIVRCLHAINIQYSDSGSPGSGRMGSKKNFLSRLVAEMRPDLAPAVEFVLSAANSVSNTSPLANAPIHDILLHR